MREAYRLQKIPLQTALEVKDKYLVIFMIYTANELPLYDSIFEKMTAVLQDLEKIVG